MRLVNFSIPSSIELEVQGKIIDLHNFYKLREVCYSCNGRVEVEFRWGDLAYAGGPEKVLITLNNVEFMKVLGTLDDACYLDDMGFKEEDEVDEDFVSSAQYNFPNSHFVMFFSPEFIIRVKAQEATISISP